MSSTFGLEDRVAIVTGGGTGIGKGIALAFAEAGAHVVLAGRHSNTLDAVADQVRALGRESLSVVTDVTDGKQVVSLVDATMAQFGRVDILVNNAGGTGGSGLLTPVVEMSEEYWTSTIHLNLMSTFLCCSAAGKVMIKQKSGNIINISSASGQRGRPGGAAYAASKAAVNNLTESLAAELAGYHVRVNAIAPGPIGVREASDAEREERAARSGILVGRLGEPADIGAAAVYLASDASAFLTGVVIDVRGGPLLREADVQAFLAKHPAV